MNDDMVKAESELAQGNSAFHKVSCYSRLYRGAVNGSNCVTDCYIAWIKPGELYESGIGVRT